VKLTEKRLLDFTVDKLTNSVENAISCEIFKTEVLPLSHKDLKTIFKKEGWKFNWRAEFKLTDRTVFKLIISGNSSNVIHGLISLTPTVDNVFMNLIESAPFNIGKTKIYLGVPGNLVAFACKQSFQRGTEGYVSFYSKTKLIGHYEKTLGAVHIGGHLMVINTNAALKLMDKYFKK
jgi:hypothetical protein